MHIAALDPRYLRREEVTPEMLEKSATSIANRLAQPEKPSR